ncbi:hypothetical protein PCASD_06664 [Puccinia coronata f. sp. avenae]|uniref:Mitochondrial carrier n=1 Tax=Puccinia coronata f. sp. avenae TaxID=200324 RepID=A0A2N5UGV1_9BASI|nr:hypothetical protein PCASD_06664 [Puccinia coronata f. sp. avenae]
MGYADTSSAAFSSIFLLTSTHYPGSNTTISRHTSTSTNALAPITTPPAAVAGTPSAMATTATTTMTATSRNEAKTKKGGKTNLVEYFIAGGAAGAMSRTVVSPLERLKIIFQCQGPGQPQYHGIWHSLVKIGKEEGWQGYFKGNGINVIRIAPYSAIQFTTYEMAKKVLTSLSASEQLSTPLRLGAGAFAGICSVVCTYPLDLVRSRLSVISASIGGAVQQGSSNREMGMVAMGKMVYKHEAGSRASTGAWSPPSLAWPRTWAPTLRHTSSSKRASVHPYPLSSQITLPLPIPVAVNKAARNSLTTSCANWPAVLSPATFSQTITYPLDVLRRRMQVVGLNSLGFQYHGAWDASLKIIRKEGVVGLYKGLWPNFLKVAPSIGTSFVTYELVRDYLLTL